MQERVHTADCGCIFHGDGYGTNLCAVHHVEIVARIASVLPNKDREFETDSTNPKDLVGNKKVSISKLPAVAILHASHAMMHGANLYGPFNWREKKVQAEIYIDAAMRHITAWNEREETASDSGVHHLGHAIACLAILLDAQESGNLVDDRPMGGGSFHQALARLNNAIAEKAAK